MAFIDIIALSILGIITGCVVGLLSAGGGVLIFPVLHVMYPELSIHSIVTICLNQILCAAFISFQLHNKIQRTILLEPSHLIMYMCALILITIYANIIGIAPGVISAMFIIFLSIGLVLRFVMKLKPGYVFKKRDLLCSLISTSGFGVIIGLGGSLVLYPLLRIGQYTATQALRLCSFNAFSIGLIGSISHDISYLMYKQQSPFPWKILLIILLTSCSTSYIVTQYAYRLKQTTIDYSSNIMLLCIIIFYTYRVYVG